MSDPPDTEMVDTHDCSGLLDDTQSETISLAGRPKGSTLRQRRLSQITESPADYADLFRALQIRPESYERFLNGVLKVLRQKNIKELQSGTDAKIRQLSRLVVRGYRTLIWEEGSYWLQENGRPGAKWLLEREELDGGEEQLLHGGDNERFYPLLEPIWRRMRDLVFEPKPRPKGRGGRVKNAREATGAESAYEADNDTELDMHPAPDRARDQTLRKLNKLIADAPEPTRRYMSADETDEAIVDLVLRLADTRARSDPTTFRRLWDQHVGRLDELETSYEHHNHPHYHDRFHQTEALASTGYDEAAVSRPANLSNEPFATAGNPVPPPPPPPPTPSAPSSWPCPLPARIPAVMAVYITTAPAESPYTQQAYEWLDAPVRMVDQSAFGRGLMLRVGMRAERVRGWAMSYGWCDVCRWVAKGLAGEREAWGVLQRDLAWAAGRGVGVWRMKVLVVGA